MQHIWAGLSKLALALHDVAPGETKRMTGLQAMRSNPRTKHMLNCSTDVTFKHDQLIRSQKHDAFASSKVELPRYPKQTTPANQSSQSSEPNPARSHSTEPIQPVLAVTQTHCRCHVGRSSGHASSPSRCRKRGVATGSTIYHLQSHYSK